MLTSPLALLSLLGCALRLWLSGRFGEGSQHVCPLGWSEGSRPSSSTEGLLRRGFSCSLVQVSTALLAVRLWLVFFSVPQQFSISVSTFCKWPLPHTLRSSCLEWGLSPASPGTFITLMSSCHRSVFFRCPLYAGACSWLRSKCHNYRNLAVSAYVPIPH